jgi:hypothetical protein
MGIRVDVVAVLGVCLLASVPWSSPLAQEIEAEPVQGPCQSLETYAFEAVHLLATVTGGPQPFALFACADGSMQVARVGDRMASTYVIIDIGSHNVTVGESADLVGTARELDGFRIFLAEGRTTAAEGIRRHRSR